MKNTKRFVHEKGQDHPLMGRFLTSAVLGCISQTKLARHLGVSVTSVTRWCRGVVELQDERHFEAISDLTGIPKETFLAVRILGKPEVRDMGYFGTLGAWPFLLRGTDTFTICGASMNLGGYLLLTERVEHLMELDVCLMDPCADPYIQISPLRRFAETEGDTLGVNHTMWLATVRQTIACETKGIKRLWVRPTPAMWQAGAQRPHSGILIANDYVAIEGDPTNPGSKFLVHVRGDEMWKMFIEPLRQVFRCKSGTEYMGYTPIWSNLWKRDDERFDRVRQCAQSAYEVSAPPIESDSAEKE